MAKPPNQAASEAVSKNESAPVTVTDPSQALAVTGDGDISGPLDLALSQEMQDKLAEEFVELLHQAESGFDALTNPTDIATGDGTKGVPFRVIDAITIPDYLDKQKGEILTKHVFRLEFLDGRILTTMQGDARPRAALARLFTVARLRGFKIRLGPYLYEKKPIPGQPQAAWIFTQQPGFKAERTA